MYEGEKTCFNYCVIPKSNGKKLEGKYKIEIVEAENLGDVLNKISE